MNWKRWTIIFISATFVSIAIYDVLAISGGGTEASISHTLIVWSYKYPVLTFCFGFVMGHLFWRVRDTKELIAISESTRKEDAG
jgi:hypothetical protein